MLALWLPFGERHWPQSLSAVLDALRLLLRTHHSVGPGCAILQVHRSVIVTAWADLRPDIRDRFSGLLFSFWVWLVLGACSRCSRRPSMNGRSCTSSWF